MDLLEHFFHSPPLPSHMIRRDMIKLPESGFVNLHGCRGGGKTFEILHMLSLEPPRSYLYIDLESPALLLQTLDTFPLQAFLNENGIETLVLDHYVDGLLDELPKVKRCIIVSRLPISDHKTTAVKYNPLNFLELKTINKNKSAHTLLNDYIKKGNLPLSWAKETNLHIESKRFIQEKFSIQEQSFLPVLARFHTYHTTPHQLYTFAKEYFKISKDWLYQTIKEYQLEGIVTLINDRIRKNGKKLIFFDHALVHFLTASRPFNVTFDGMVAHTLLQTKTNIEALGRHGYILDSTLYLPAPFENKESLQAFAKRHLELYDSYEIQHVVILSIHNRFSFKEHRITFESIPFCEWNL